MHFDRLDEIYAIVQSNWQFDKANQSSLTGSLELFSEPRYLPILGANSNPQQKK